MITDSNSEDRLAQQTFAQHLETALGWGQMEFRHQLLRRHTALARHSDRNP